MTFTILSDIIITKWEIITNREAAKNDYNLSPSRYVTQNSKDETLPLEEAVVLLKEVKEDRREVDEKLNEILNKLGVDIDG